MNTSTTGMKKSRRQRQRPKGIARGRAITIHGTTEIANRFAQFVWNYSDSLDRVNFIPKRGNQLPNTKERRTRFPVIVDIEYLNSRRGNEAADVADEFSQLLATWLVQDPVPRLYHVILQDGTSGVSDSITWEELPSAPDNPETIYDVSPIDDGAEK